MSGGDVPHAATRPGHRRWPVLVALIMAATAAAVLLVVRGDDDGGGRAGPIELAVVSSVVATALERDVDRLSSPAVAADPVVRRRIARRLSRHAVAARRTGRRVRADLAPGPAHTGLDRACTQLGDAAGDIGRVAARGGPALTLELRAGTDRVAGARTRIAAVVASLRRGSGRGERRVLDRAVGAVERGDADLPLDASLTIGGTGSGDLTGAAISGVGDFNGDGRGDLAVASPGRGEVLVGLRPEEAELDPDQPGGGKVTIGGLDARRSDELGAFELFGLARMRVAPAGDVNGDRLADVLIGVPEADGPGGERAGAAFVVYGSRSPARVNVTMLEQEGRGFRIDGPGPFWRIGRAVAGVGDFNGDGRHDIAIGARARIAPEDVTAAAGRAVTWVLFGGTERRRVTLRRRGPPPSGLRIDGYGDTLAPAGDFDGDGLDDLVGGDANHQMGIPGGVGSCAVGGGPARSTPRGPDAGARRSSSGADV